jgi:hypothetical protein
VRHVLKDDIYRTFEKRGQQLCGTEQVQSLLSKIAAIEDTYPLKDWHQKPVMPFVHLEGSSGLGKTQMAFNLSASGRVVHFVTATDLSENPQSIYSCFKDRSKDFLLCVEQDLEFVEPCSVSDFIQPLSPLWTFGFINAVIKNETEIKSPLTYEEIRQSLDALFEQNKENRPIWFLDEFPLLQEFESPSKKRNWSEIRFMRNIFRALNLVVIISSTNSSSANLVKGGNASRGSTTPLLWCTIFPELPSYQLSDERIRNNIFWRNILSKSRPLFSEAANEFLKQTLDKGESISPKSLVTLLDDLSNVVWNKAQEAKTEKNAQNVSFLHGQVCLFLCHCCVEDSEKNSPLVHRHFGILDITQATDLYLKCLQLHIAEPDSENLSAEPWTARSTLSELNDDILLYLCLMGGKNRIALDNRWSDPLSKNFHMPLSIASDMLLKSQKLKLIFSNDEQLSNDGMQLEAEVVGGLVIASHADGFAGTKFKSLLPRFLYEMGIYYSLDSMPEVCFPERLKNWTEEMIPFLSPPNRKWPDFLYEGNLNFGNIERNKKEDRIDFEIIDQRFTGECTDYTSPLSNAAMKEILIRVPEKSRIHLLCTTKIQKSFFSKKAYEGFIQSHHHLKETVVYKLVADNEKEQFHFAQVPGMQQSTDSNATRLVLLIPRDDLLTSVKKANQCKVPAEKKHRVE